MEIGSRYYPLPVVGDTQVHYSYPRRSIDDCQYNFEHERACIERYRKWIAGADERRKEAERRREALKRPKPKPPVPMMKLTPSKVLTPIPLSSTSADDSAKCSTTTVVAPSAPPTLYPIGGAF